MMIAEAVIPQASTMLTKLSLSCWHCAAHLTRVQDREEDRDVRCTHCNSVTALRDGIWRAPSPADLEHYSRFIAEYEAIRHAEGRGSDEAPYYLALPYEDLSGRNADQWKIRAHTFDSMKRRIIAPLARQKARPLQVLDLGAGNGWLSRRLAELGHSPVAVDLLTNTHDGLAAARHYATVLEHIFPRVQASLDRLPFAPSTFDLAIFNASFHYSTDFARTLGEAVRCVRPGGLIVLADSPWYAHDESGRQMIEEKHGRFEAKYGFPSNSIPSLEYLSPTRLETLALAWGLQWRTLKPFYGVSWAMRPIKAMLEGRRKPSRFYIHVTEVVA